MTVKLVVFDLDGTLLRGDTVCLAIARALGRYDRMLEFEGARNEDEVLAARVEMANWYLEAGESAVIESLETLQLAPGAIEGVRSLHDESIDTMIVSITWGFGVAAIAEQLGIARYRASELDFSSGDITHIFGRHKGPIVNTEMELRGLEAAEVAAVGDTPNDYSMLELVGHRYYVGSEAPSLDNCHHLPNADIRTIATSIIKAR